MFSASESVFKDFKPFPSQQQRGTVLVTKKSDYLLAPVKNDQFFLSRLRYHTLHQYGNI